MAASHSQVGQQISLTQIKAKLTEINQHSEELSEFKVPVLKAIRDYINEVETRFTSIDQTRLTMLKEMLDEVKEHDLTFLKYVIDQALSIKDASSSLRDKIGKEAMLQNSRYITSMIEFAIFLPIMYSILDTTVGSGSFIANGIMALFALAALYTIDYLQHAYFNGLSRHNTVHQGIDQISKDISSTTVNELISLPLQVGNYKLGELDTRSSTIVKNVSHFIHANLLFYRPQPQQAASQPHQTVGHVAALIPLPAPPPAGPK